VLEDRYLLSAGALDPTFGTGGTVTTSFGGNNSFPTFAEAVKIQPDGKSVAGGFNESSGGGIYDLARYDADGSLDSAFGNKGEVQTKFVGSSAYAYALALQADGKILLAGKVNSTFEILRYNSDGSLDSTFGNKGKVSTSFPQGAAEIRSLALETVGGVTKIVAAGDVITSSSFAFALAGYNLNGSLDTSFGSGGLVVTNMTGRFDNTLDGIAGAVQGDGKIVVAGETAQASGEPEFALARYNTDGGLDATFGSGGLVFTSFGFFAAVHAVALQPDGKIVAAGVGRASGSVTDYQHFALARYNSDGSLDTSFGRAGMVLSPSTIIGASNGVAIEADGKIMAAGRGSNLIVAVSGAALARYNPDGSLDTTFGTDGIVFPTFGQQDTAVALQSDGKIVTTTINNGNFGLARYLPSEPQIGAFTASPNPVTAGSSMTLTASNITDDNANSTITQIAFYVQINGTNTLLGYGTQTSPGVWTFTFTVNLAPGTDTLFAQAEDSYGVFGDPFAITLTVQ
jgi:uncharacterized delta-60 repeat protein